MGQEDVLADHFKDLRGSAESRDLLLAWCQCIQRGYRSWDVGDAQVGEFGRTDLEDMMLMFLEHIDSKASTGAEMTANHKQLVRCMKTEVDLVNLVGDDEEEDSDQRPHEEQMKDILPRSDDEVPDQWQHIGPR